MGHGLLRWTLQPNITPVARLLAYVTGLVNQELLLKSKYLLAENCILKAICSQASGSPVPSELRSPKSVNAWAANYCSKSLESPSPTPFSAGIANW